MTVVFVLLGCLIAPNLGDPKLLGIFTYIQEFQGYISPGILAAFIFGFLVKKAPPSAGLAALILCVPIYGGLQLFFGEIAFLNRMAITFVAILIVMGLITYLKPLPEPVVLPKRDDFDMSPTPQAVWLGTAVIIITLAMYVVFW
jgi:SSS family solute:Na+ symporter